MSLIVPIIVLLGSIGKSMMSSQTTETYVPYSVPYLTSANESQSTLQPEQTLTDNGHFGFGFSTAAESASKMFIRDLESGREVWSVTLPGTIAKVRVTEGIMVASDADGKVLWSSPAPTGPNAGAPYYLRVTDSGALILLDSRNSVVFQTPVPQAVVVPTQTALPAATAVQISEDVQVTGPLFMRPLGPYGLPAIFSVPQA
jgi:outer membrane protein assembly factor BamB